MAAAFWNKSQQRAMQVGIAVEFHANKIGEQTIIIFHEWSDKMMTLIQYRNQQSGTSRPPFMAIMDQYDNNDL